MIREAPVVGAILLGLHSPEEEDPLHQRLVAALQRHDLGLELPPGLGHHIAQPHRLTGLGRFSCEGREAEAWSAELLPGEVHRPLVLRDLRRSGLGGDEGRGGEDVKATAAMREGMRTDMVGSSRVGSVISREQWPRRPPASLRQTTYTGARAPTWGAASTILRGAGPRPGVTSPQPPSLALHRLLDP